VPFTRIAPDNSLGMSRLRWERILWHAACIERTHINQSYIMNNQLESTYGMLVRSEEKGRDILEILVYTAVILSVVFSIWQVAETPLKVPAPGADPCVACDTTKTQLRAGS
jgi:hypothetical protein